MTPKNSRPPEHFSGVRGREQEHGEEDSCPQEEFERADHALKRKVMSRQVWARYGKMFFDTGRNAKTLFPDEGRSETVVRRDGMNGKVRDNIL